LNFNGLHDVIYQKVELFALNAWNKYTTILFPTIN
jgi:hypothetical protein